MTRRATSGRPWAEEERSGVEYAAWVKEKKVTAKVEPKVLTAAQRRRAAVQVEPATCRSPRHKMSGNLANEDSQFVG